MADTLGRGTTLSYATYTEGSTTLPVLAGLTAIAKLVGITPPTLESEEVEGRHMTSAGYRNEPVPTWIDAGEIGARIRYLASEKTTLMGFLQADKVWSIEFTDGGIYQVVGWLKSMTDDAPIDGLIESDIVIRCHGQEDWDDGS